MTILTRQQLEQAAVRANANGDTWPTFWQAYGPHAVALEPHDRGRFHRLVRRLTTLVAAGDTDGERPLDNPFAPWEEVDAQTAPVLKPNDTYTQARIDWTAAGVAPVHIGG